MVTQTSRLSGDDSEGPVQGVARGAANVLADGLDLAQLQAELFKSDLKIAESSIRSSVVMGALAIGLIVSGVPVLAFGIAHLLAWFLQWPNWLCESMIGGVCVSVAAALTLKSLNSVKRGMGAFEKSQAEFLENVRWLQSTVRQDFKDNVH